MGSVVSDKIFKVFYFIIYRENKPHFLAAVFLTNHDCLNKETFLPSNIAFGQFVFDKKKFKIFYTDIYGK